jgi:hypothetical protein
MRDSWFVIWHSLILLFEYFQFDRNVSRKPRIAGEAKGHNIDDITMPGSPALWVESFQFAI